MISENQLSFIYFTVSQNRYLFYTRNDTLPVASYTKLKGFLPNRKQMNAKVFI